MNNDELDKLARELGIAKEHIIREEAEMEILDKLSRNKIGASVIFYGGTALRLAYNSPRYSEDIDLLQIKNIDFINFKKILSALVKDKTDWQIKDVKNKRQTIFALLIIKPNDLKHSLPIKIEIHKPARLPNIVSRLMLIKSPASTAQPLMMVPALTELRQLKIDALQHRRKARDVFDLWYIAQTARENFVLPANCPNYSKKEFANELQKFLPRKFYNVIGQLYEQTLPKY